MNGSRWVCTVCSPFLLHSLPPLPPRAFRQTTHLLPYSRYATIEAGKAETPYRKSTCNMYENTREREKVRVGGSKEQEHSHHARITTHALFPDHQPIPLSFACYSKHLDERLQEHKCASAPPKARPYSSPSLPPPHIVIPQPNHLPPTSGARALTELMPPRNRSPFGAFRTPLK